MLSCTLNSETYLYGSEYDSGAQTVDKIRIMHKNSQTSRVSV